MDAIVPFPLMAATPDEDAPEGAGAKASALDLGAAFASHGAFVFRVLRRLGVADAILDDAVQEVFLVAHRRWDSYDPEASIRGWLFGIARRIASHHHRSRRRAERNLAGAPVPPPSTSPEDIAARREAVAFVEGFVAGLDEDKRTVFVGCCIEGMSAPELAEALGANLNTVYSRLRVTKQAFERAVARRQRAEGRES